MFEAEDIGALQNNTETFTLTVSFFFCILFQPVIEDTDVILTYDLKVCLLQ